MDESLYSSDYVRCSFISSVSQALYSTWVGWLVSFAGFTSRSLVSKFQIFQVQYDYEAEIVCDEKDSNRLVDRVGLRESAVKVAIRSEGFSRI